MTARVPPEHGDRKKVILDVRSTALLAAIQQAYYVRNGVRLQPKVIIRYALYLYRNMQIANDGGEAGL